MRYKKLGDTIEVNLYNETFLIKAEIKSLNRETNEYAATLSLFDTEIDESWLLEKDIPFQAEPKDIRMIVTRYIEQRNRDKSFDRYIDTWKYRQHLIKLGIRFAEIAKEAI